jgi:hypothetical protein
MIHALYPTQREGAKGQDQKLLIRHKRLFKLYIWSILIIEPWSSLYPLWFKTK